MKPKIIFSLLVMLMITLSCNEQEMPVLDDSAGASDAVSLQDDVVSNARTSAEMSTVYTFAGMINYSDIGMFGLSVSAYFSVKESER